MGAGSAVQRRSFAMKGFVEHIDAETIRNSSFRRVLCTGAHLQLVLMSLAKGEEIGVETHENHDQFFRIEAGEDRMVIDGAAHAVRDGDPVIVPAGARHNLVNTGAQPLKLYTLYGPPNHLDRLVEAGRANAMASFERFDGVTTEESVLSLRPATLLNRRAP
jgi:mannose-6-phosphate isomerase-like protein (cupin superfamily)